jgi:hypothetical protein
VTTLTLSTGRKVSTKAIEKAAELAQEKFPEVFSYTRGFDAGYLDLYADVVPVSVPDKYNQYDFAGWHLAFYEGKDGNLSYFDVRVNTVKDGWTEDEPDGEVFDQCITHLNKVKWFFFETIGLTEEDFNATIR